MFLTVFFTLIFLLWFVQGFDLIRGVLFLIPELKPGGRNEGILPKVSIVFAARNEERTVTPALRSMLAQDYPDFEVIAVNDRSEDATISILKSFNDPRLKVLDIRQLPEGWLGKNNALYQGFRASGGSWVLFTDADIHLHPDCLKACAREFQKNNWDHMVLFPKLTGQNWLETMFSTAFLLGFYRSFRPWEARNPKSKAAVGVGAFNLVRRELYLKAGTHERLALNVIDDVDLGRLMKQSGARQSAFTAPGLVAVEWVSGWKGIFKSLEKNAFAGFRYHLPLALLALFGGFCCDVLPFFALFFGGYAFFLPAAATVFMIFLVYLTISRTQPASMLAFPVHPLSTILLLTVMAAAVSHVLRKGGVTWRGTFYPLAKLRAASDLS